MQSRLLESQWDCSDRNGGHKSVGGLFNSGASAHGVYILELCMRLALPTEPGREQCDGAHWRRRQRLVLFSAHSLLVVSMCCHSGIKSDKPNYKPLLLPLNLFATIAAQKGT